MEHLLSTQFFLYAFISYGAIFIFFLLTLASGKHTPKALFIPFLVLSFSLHSIAMIMRTLEFKHLPLTGLYEYVSSSAWLGAVILLFLHFYVKNWFMEFSTVFIIIILMVMASLLPKEGSVALVPALQSSWLYVHVSAAALSEVLFGIACVSSVAFLVKSHLLPDSKLLQAIPELSVLDTITYRTISVGYPLFTIGALFAGAIWAYRAWGSFWSWDPKETSSLVVWIVYSIYLHVRLKRKQKNIAHILSILGFIAAIFTLLSSMFLGGLHSYG